MLWPTLPSIIQQEQSEECFSCQWHNFHVVAYWELKSWLNVTSIGSIQLGGGCTFKILNKIFTDDFSF